jgi:hypothetical protein
MARDLAMRLLRSTATLSLVLAIAAATLWGLDRVPQLLTMGRHEQHFATVGELERHLGRSLALPAYFPSSVRWPPTVVRLLGRGARVVVLGMRRSTGGGEAIWLAQTVEGEEPIAADVLAPVVVMASEPVRLGTSSGTLSRALGEHGALWREVAWRRNGRSLLLRSRGGLEHLLRMAESMRSEGHD